MAWRRTSRRRTPSSGRVDGVIEGERGALVCAMCDGALYATVAGQPHAADEKTDDLMDRALRRRKRSRCSVGAYMTLRARRSLL